MNDPADGAVPLHLPQLLDQHLLGDCWNCPLQLRKPQQLPAEQMEEDHQLPATFEDLQRPFDTARGHGGRALCTLTLGGVPYFSVRSCHFESLILPSRTSIGRAGRAQQTRKEYDDLARS